MSDRLRIAFVTPEYITESEGGGLGTYLYRMAQALIGCGHEPHIFVTSRKPPTVRVKDGVHVHRVESDGSGKALKMAWRLSMMTGLGATHPTLLDIGAARALAAAVRDAELTQPFDFIQSSDYTGAGLYIEHRPERPHIVRCSSASDLCMAANGETSLRHQLRQRLWMRTIRRAERAYAPSRFVADHFARKLGINVHVIRPPAFVERHSDPGNLPKLPRRFFVYFGQVMPLKGTSVLAEALPEVWRAEPEFRILFIGRFHCNTTDWLRRWGEHRAKAVFMHSADRPTLFAILRRADAAVLPSLVDNLPNTVIESLLHGLPVIGSRGASIDEMVEHEKTGLLVPPGDAAALAAAIIRQWRGQSPVNKGFAWSSTLRDEMHPPTAVQNLLAFALPQRFGADAATNAS
jgi:glycogen(starch) synthase